MLTWTEVWRKGFVPALSLDQLRAIRAGLVANDPRIIQGSTTDPPNILSCGEMRVEKACIICYAGWKADCYDLVGVLAGWFDYICWQAESFIGVGNTRWFLNWVDSVSRSEMITELLPEVDRAIHLKTPTPQEVNRCVRKLPRRI